MAVLRHPKELSSALEAELGVIQRRSAGQEIGQSNKLQIVCRNNRDETFISLLLAFCLSLQTYFKLLMLSLHGHIETLSAQANLGPSRP
jgi:hypothetical protein